MIHIVFFLLLPTVIPNNVLFDINIFLQWFLTNLFCMYSYYDTSYKLYFILDSLTLIYLFNLPYIYASDQVTVVLTSIIYLNVFYLPICR